MRFPDKTISDSGSSAIEFALVVPVLLLLSLGLINGWSFASFVINMRAGVGSAANLYLQGAGDDDLVEATAVDNWQQRPGDAAIVIEREYSCGTAIVGPEALCSGSKPPSIDVVISASGTWVAPLGADLLVTQQTVTHEQTVRIR